MKKYPAFIVVEGKTDKDFIDSFLDCDIITTNGSDVSRETINFIKEAATKRKVIVLTDPDAPGSRIRSILNDNIPGLENAFVPKEKCIKRHKVGVAESSKNVVLEALTNLVPGVPINESNLTINDLCELGLIGCDRSSEKRKILEDKLHLGHTNGKSFLGRCQALGLSRKNLEEALSGREKLI
jgi:ribonuclease M5